MIPIPLGISNKFSKPIIGFVQYSNLSSLAPFVPPATSALNLDIPALIAPLPCVANSFKASCTSDIVKISSYKVLKSLVPFGSPGSP